MNSRILGLASLLLVGCVGPVHVTPQPEQVRVYVVSRDVGWASMSHPEVSQDPGIFHFKPDSVVALSQVPLTYWERSTPEELPKRPGDPLHPSLTLRTRGKGLLFPTHYSGKAFLITPGPQEGLSPG